MIDSVTLHRSDINGNSLAANGRLPVTHPQSKLSGHHTYLTFAQGSDTDCFGEIIGSILGAYYGPGHLEERWLAPFNDEIHTGLAGFYEQTLSKVAKRMGELPKRITAKITHVQ